MNVTIEAFLGKKEDLFSNNFTGRDLQYFWCNFPEFLQNLNSSITTSELVIKENLFEKTKFVNAAISLLGDKEKIAFKTREQAAVVLKQLMIDKYRDGEVIVFYIEDNKFYHLRTRWETDGSVINLSLLIPLCFLLVAEFLLL